MEQTLAKERYSADFLLDDGRGSNFEHDLPHVPGCSELSFTYNGTCVERRVTHCTCLFSVTLLLFSAPERNWTFRFCYISSSYAYLFLRFLRLFGLNAQILTKPYLKNTNVPLISFTYIGIVRSRTKAMEFCKWW